LLDRWRIVAEFLRVYPSASNTEATAFGCSLSDELGRGKVSTAHLYVVHSSLF
jgi:hypothetical protein